MKSLISFIKESIQVNESESFSIWKRTAANAIETGQLQDSLNLFTKRMKGKKMSLENKDHLAKVYNEFLNCVKFGDKQKVLRKYDLDNMWKFKDFLLKSKDILEKSSSYDTSWIKDFDLTELQKEYKKAKESGEVETGEKKNKEDSEDRDLVIYHRYNPSNYLVYKFTGNRGKSTQHYVRMCRMDFAWETGVKYWETYDCLANYYFSHSAEELKELHKKEDNYEEDPNEFK